MAKQEDEMDNAYFWQDKDLDKALYELFESDQLSSEDATDAERPAKEQWVEEHCHIPIKTIKRWSYDRLLEVIEIHDDAEAGYFEDD